MRQPADRDDGPVRDYYRRNFGTLLDTVGQLYDDLLSERENGYIGKFKSLSPDAQCLYVRLISRVGPLFRNDKIRYDEITDIAAAAQELKSREMLEIDSEYECEVLLPLLLKQEIVDLVELLDLDIESPVKVKKTDLIEQIISLGIDALVNKYRKTLFTIYEPLEADVLTVLKLLFFGNFRQDLTEFIITDLGIVTYESYPLKKDARPFRDRRTVDYRVILHNLADELYENLRELSVEEILEFTARLLESVPDPDHDPRIRRRFDRICVEIGRQLERLDSLTHALEVYGRAGLPPSRERQARIYYNRGNYEYAEEICLAIAEDPLNEEEAVFAKSFHGKVRRKLGDPYKRKQDVPVLYQEYQLHCPTPPSVETYSVEGFIASGYKGFSTENQLWTALYGLAFWDIIFQPVEGVFYNQYQRGPSDLGTEQFYRRRKQQIDSRIQYISTKKKWDTEILDRYDEKNGVACALVNWRRITREMVKLAVSRIPRPHLVAIFGRMSRDIHANTSGFPDLIVYPPKRAGKKFSIEDGFAVDDDIGRSYVLIEVKGPGDQVQKNQKRWMEYFVRHGIPYRVFRMTAADLAE